jgi:Sulfotransferase family
VLSLNAKNAARLPVLHIGFNKAGSTTLQNGLFHRHPEVACLGEPCHDRYPGVHEAMFNAMLSCHRDPARRVPFDLANSRRLWHETLEALEPGKMPVYSKESLVRMEFYEGPGDHRLPEKLYAITGPARIVIMGRHQIKLLESLYITRTKGHYYLSPDDWFKANHGGWAHIYQYYAMASAYATVYGRENVGVFLLEDLVGDVTSFAQRLCEFIGIDPAAGAELLQGQRWNTRTTQRTHIYSRLRKSLGPDIRLSRFAPAPVRNAFLNFMEGGRSARVELPTNWVAEMEAYYRDDNCKLAAEWGLPLKDHGYPL